MNAKTLKTWFSSTSDNWSTPQWLFDEISEEFGGFDIDACAFPENAKCDIYFTPEMDGLKQEWRGKVWCNPPYGRETGAWVKKAHDDHTKFGTTVVMLLPARTDVKWFHEYIYGKTEIRFLKGRLKFGDSKNPAPFPSMIVVFRREVME